MNSENLQEIQKKLERYCSYQERCQKDVLQKLQKLESPPEVTEVVLEYLLRNDYLNEERFARSLVRGKFRFKKWGRLRLLQELTRNNISERHVGVALGELDEKIYRDTFYRLAEKRFSEINESHPLKKKKKLAAYLLYKGWEPGWVYEKVNELITR